MPATNLSTMQYRAPNPADHKQMLNSNHTAELNVAIYRLWICMSKDGFFFFLNLDEGVVYLLVEFSSGWGGVVCFSSIFQWVDACVASRAFVLSEIKLPLNCLLQVMTSWWNWWTPLSKTWTLLTLLCVATLLLAQVILIQAQGHATYRPEIQTKNKIDVIT